MVSDSILRSGCNSLPSGGQHDLKKNTRRPMRLKCSPSEGLYSSATLLQILNSFDVWWCTEIRFHLPSFGWSAQFFKKTVRKTVFDEMYFVKVIGTHFYMPPTTTATAPTYNSVLRGMMSPGTTFSLAWHSSVYFVFILVLLLLLPQLLHQYFLLFITSSTSYFAPPLVPSYIHSALLHEKVVFLIFYRLRHLPLLPMLTSPDRQHSANFQLSMWSV